MSFDEVSQKKRKLWIGSMLVLLIVYILGLIGIQFYGFPVIPTIIVMMIMMFCVMSLQIWGMVNIKLSFEKIATKKDEEILVDEGD